MAMKVSVLHVLIGSALSLALLTGGELQAQKKAPFLGPKSSPKCDFCRPTPKQAALQKGAEGATGDKACRDYLESEDLSVGMNFAGTRDEIVVQIGAKPTKANLNSPHFIDSRYMAFREAMLDAKKKMAKFLEQKIESSAMSHLTPKRKGMEDRASLEQKAAGLKAQAAKKGETAAADYGVSNTVKKSMRWLNAKLDSALEAEGVDPRAEEKARQATNKAEQQRLLAEARKAEAKAKQIIQSAKFKERIKAVAKLRMKGIYTISTNETVTPKRATVCVVAAYSPKSEMLADAMASRDFSQVPQVDPDIRIRNQLLDRTEKARLIEEGRPEEEAAYRAKIALASAWGIDIMFDQNGHVNLVAYGQAGVGNKPNRIKRDKARARAQLTAENLIRLFITSTFQMEQVTRAAENLDELADGTTKVKFDKDTEEKLMVNAAAMAINGISPVHSWTFIHPATSQEIHGSVVKWNASAAAGAIASKERQGRVVKDTGGAKYKAKARQKRVSPTATGKRAPVRRGRVSTTKRSKRF